MTKKKLPYKKVRVIWQDICSSSQWYDDLTDVDKFSYSWCEDIGYLYYKDSKVLKIFTSSDPATTLCLQRPRVGHTIGSGPKALQQKISKIILPIAIGVYKKG